MALIRDFLMLTFDEHDEKNEKLVLLKKWLDNGYKIIFEIKENDTGEIKEWMLAGPVGAGKLSNQLPKRNILEFNPAGEEK